MSETNNLDTTTIRVKIKTYHILEDLVRKKKRINLQETGKVGDADFDGIINDLLSNKTISKNMKVGEGMKQNVKDKKRKKTAIEN